MFNRIFSGMALFGLLLTGAEAAVFTIGAGDVEGLKQALSDAAANGDADVIELAPGSVYPVDTSWSLEGRLIINGRGAQITGVAGQFAGLVVPADSLVTINDVHFTQVQARGVAALSNSGTLRLARTTVSVSYGEFCGRVVCQIGSAVANSESGTLILEGSTVASNTIAILNNGILSLKGATISGNGIGLRGTGQVTAVNSIIAGNDEDCDIGNLESLGHNLDSDGSCGFNQPSDLSDTNPRLGNFGDHGGLVPTVALRPGSPAIDAGDPNRCTLVDGRGFVRAHGPNRGCDVGAYERDGRVSDIQPALTATWFDVREDGHFFNVQVLDSNRNEVLVHWNTFDASGNHLWLQGLGQIRGHRVDMVLHVSGGMRYPDFDPADRTYEPWGTLTLAFASCWRAAALYEPLDPVFGPPAESRLVRLTATAGLSCR